MSAEKSGAEPGSSKQASVWNDIDAKHEAYLLELRATRKAIRKLLRPFRLVGMDVDFVDSMWRFSWRRSVGTGGSYRAYVTARTTRLLLQRVAERWGVADWQRVLEGRP